MHGAHASCSVWQKYLTLLTIILVWSVTLSLFNSSTQDIKWSTSTNFIKLSHSNRKNARHRDSLPSELDTSSEVFFVTTKTWGGGGALKTMFETRPVSSGLEMSLGKV